MKRRHFLGKVAAGALGGALASSATVSAEPSSTVAPAADPASPLVRTPLVLMAPRPDGIEAVWAVSRLARGRIEWQGDDGTSGSAGTDPFGFVPQGESILRIRLDGLRSGQRYRVRAVTTAADTGERVTSPWKSFSTLNPAAASSTFVVWNDTHINNATIQQLHEKTPAADFLLWNGDTCNDWRTDDLLIPTLLFPGERDISTDRPLNVVWGNHDVRGKFAFEMPRMIATPSGRPFHAFRSGPVACVCLHTGEDKPDDHPTFGGRVAFDLLREEQAAWLAETIQRPEIASAPYRIVFCHIPLRWVDEQPQDYANGGFDQYSARSRTAWHDTLVAWKTQLIISGHTHQATWMPPTTEFPYGQLIGGGPKVETATWIQGMADATRLHIAVHDLTGAVIREVTLTPLASV